MVNNYKFTVVTTISALLSITADADKYKNNQYVICGDNCWQLEYVNLNQIKGIVTEYCRKGKWHKVDNIIYKIYVHLWVDLLFIKRPIFYIRDKIKRKLK